jgi:glycosyltransferase involved in cell wall biosynthesis
MEPDSAGSAGAALYVVIPGDLDTRTGGYGYDRRIIAGLRDHGWTVNVVRLDDSFPRPTPAARGHAAHMLAAIPDGSTVLMDGLALGALPDEVEREASRLTIVALVHHPLAAETGLDPALAAALEISERRALAAVKSVVVTSHATAGHLADYGVGRERLTVVEPGTDPAPLARGSCIDDEPSRRRSLDGQARFGEARQSAARATAAALSPRPFELALLCVATLTPRKGHALLLSALASIPLRNWRLTCAGSLDRDPATVAQVRGQIRDVGLDDRISLVGDLDQSELAIQYDRADVFVLATLYEGYGMAVAEALARGVPVISTATGAIQDLVGDAGVVVSPGDLRAFTAALSSVLGDPIRRATLKANACRGRDRLPTWDAAAAAMARTLSSQRAG